MGLLLAAMVYTWVVVGGLPLAARPGSRAHYSTFAALSLLRGRLDVPERALEGECFLIGDRCYGYFGIAPALVRLPVALLEGHAATSPRTEGVYFVLGFLVTAIGLWWIARQLVAVWAPGGGRRRMAAAGFVTAWMLGASPMLFLAGRPMVYEDAILWGVAFGTLALGAAISVVRRPRPWSVGVLLAANVMGMLARPTVGAAGLLATLAAGVQLVRRSRSRPGRDGQPLRRPAVLGAVLITGAVAAFASAPLLTYAKFGTFSPPYEHLLALRRNPSLLKVLSRPGGINPSAVPTKILSVIRPDTLHLLPHPPYVALGEQVPTVVWPARLSDVQAAWEPTAGIPASMPFTAAAAAMGAAAILLALWQRGAGPRPPGAGIAALAVVSAAVSVGLQLLFPGETYRYLADWLPLLFVAGAVGIAVVAGSPRSRTRTAVAAAGALLLAGQLVVQVGLAVGNGLKVGGERPAMCLAPANPYGAVGRAFCPESILPPPSAHRTRAARPHRALGPSAE